MNKSALILIALYEPDGYSVITIHQSTRSCLGLSLFMRMYPHFRDERIKTCAVKDGWERRRKLLLVFYERLIWKNRILTWWQSDNSTPSR